MYTVILINKNVETVIHYASADKDAPHLLAMNIKLFENQASIFTFKIYKNQNGYSNILDLSTKVKIYDVFKNKIKFEGRVLISNEIMDGSGTFYKEVTCESELAYLNDSRVGLWELYPSALPEDVPTYSEPNYTILKALQKIITNHNANVELEKQFTIGVVQISGGVYFSTSRESSLDIILSKIINDTNSTIKIRKENGIRYLDILTDIPTISNTTISLRRNLKSFKKTPDYSTFCTRILAIGADGLTFESINSNHNYVENLEAISKYGIITKPFEWSDVTTKAELLQKAQAKLIEILNNEYVSVEVSALDLSYIGLTPEEFDISTRYLVTNDVQDFSEVLKVVQLDLDLLSIWNSNLTFSNTSIVSSAGSSNQQQQINKNRTETISNNNKINKKVISVDERLAAYKTLNDTTISGIQTQLLSKANKTLASAVADGLMSAGDFIKLEGIDVNAESNNLSNVEATDLTDLGDTSLHFHTSDRSRSNHTGTQLSNTISDFVATVRGSVLTGLITTTNAVITATDSVLSAFGKLQKQITDNLTSLSNHVANIANPHSVTKTQVGLSNVDNTTDLLKPISTATQTALNLKISSSQKGVSNGVAQLDANGLVPSSQLPSYVNDILEYTSNALFPATGEAGIIYLNTTTNLTYRWSGTVYAEVSPSIALGETSSTAYAGDKGATTTSNLNTHTGNATIHITGTERTNWNTASTNTHTHSNKTVLDNTTAPYTTAEQTKLSGLSASANNYVLPVATTVIGGVKSGTDITVDASGNVSVVDDSHNHVISNVDGLQTALNSKIDDSQVLTNVPVNAIFTDTIYTHPTTHTSSIISDFAATVKSTVLTGLITTTNAVISATDTVLGALGKLQKQITDNLTTLTSHTGNVSNPHIVTKTQLGLGNVENTADNTKRVLSATKLFTPRAINGVSFDGSANITITDNTKTTQTDINDSVNAINIGVRNLIIKTGEIVNTMISADGTTSSLFDTNLMLDFIPVVAGEQLMFSQISTGAGDNYFRYAFYQSNKTTLVMRTSNNNLSFSDIVPVGSLWLRVSYDAFNKVKLERGTKGTGWLPSPEDVDNAIALKVDKVAGKSLILDTDKTKLDGISTGANKVLDSTTNGNILINNLETNVYTHPVGTNPHGTTKADVGLGSVDNTSDATKNVLRATKLTTPRTIATSGDVTGTATSFDGSANISIPLTLATVATAGTYKSVTVDAKGRVTRGTNPTTLSGYGITDALPSSAYTASDILTKIKTVDGTGSGLDADLIDGLESDLLSKQFILPSVGATTTYYKIAELTTAIGSFENNGVFYINGTGNFADSSMGLDVIQFSTKGGAFLRVLTLLDNDISTVRYGYVVNATSGLTEIWVLRPSYNCNTYVKIGTTKNVTYGNLLSSTTEPVGIIYSTPTMLGQNTTGSIPLSNGTVNTNLNADMLDGNHSTAFALASHGPHVTYGTTTTSLASGGAGVIGVSDTLARSDHTHTLPAYPTLASLGLTATSTELNYTDGVTSNIQTQLNNKVDDSQVLTNVPTGAKFTDTVYTHPTNHPPSIITQNTSNRFVTDAEKTTWNGKATQTNIDASIIAIKLGINNLISRYGELVNTMVDTTGLPGFLYDSSLMVDFIPVVAGEQLTFSQIAIGAGTNYFRYAFLQTNKTTLVIRKADLRLEFTDVVPVGALWMRVSYDTTNVVKIERGNKSTGWLPSMDDKADRMTHSTTANRPIPTYIAQTHYDDTLGKPIYCHQFTPTVIWHDGSGATV